MENPTDPAIVADGTNRGADQQDELHLSRRQLLGLASTSLVLSLLPGAAPSASAQAPDEPASPQVKPVPPSLFYNFGSNHEMRWENLYSRGFLVPNELFFIRNHSRTPRIDSASYAGSKCA